MQTVLDFVFSGIVGSAHYFFKLRNNALYACSGAVYEVVDNLKKYDDGDEVSAKTEFLNIRRHFKKPFSIRF